MHEIPSEKLRIRQKSPNNVVVEKEQKSSNANDRRGKQTGIVEQLKFTNED